MRAFGELALVVMGFAVVYRLLASPDPRSHVIELAHFVEYGILATLAFASLGTLSPTARWMQSLLLVVAVGVVDEAIQWALASRVAEIRDIALNAAAGGLGLCCVGWVLRAGDRGQSARPTRAEERRLVTAGAFLFPALAAFLYVVHLGYWIRWDDVEFVSQFRPSEIDRVDEARRARWAAWSGSERNALQQPARLLALEDFYVTEARRHIQARNEAADGGDLHMATGENLIVERWYRPYLEVAGGARTDLPAELVGGPYRSPVPTHLWPGLASASVWGPLIVVELALIALVTYWFRLEKRA
ncbi:MAG: VanZ family protein [Vicinamibacteria bacterium]